MRLARILILLGAALLLGTAAFHTSGGAMVAGWLDGERGAILRMLWYAPPLDWLVVSLIWGFVAWRGRRDMAPLVWIAAIIPLGVAAMMSAAIGLDFPGIWMLAGAAILAIVGSLRLPRAA